MAHNLVAVRSKKNNEMHVNNALYFVFPGMEQEMLLWDWKGVQDLC